MEQWSGGVMECWSASAIHYSTTPSLQHPASGLRGLLRDLLRLLDQAADGVRGLRAMADPVSDAVEVEVPVLPRLFRIVVADLLDEFAVARAAAVGDDDFVIRVVERTLSAESDGYCHNSVG